MQKLALISVLFLAMMSYVQSSALNMTSMMPKDRHAYEIDAGHFDNESSALQLKFKLAAAIQEPISVIKNQNDHSYDVKVGPIKNLQSAQQVQDILHQGQIIPSADAMRSMPMTIPMPKQKPIIVDKQTVTTMTVPNVQNAEAITIEPEKRLWNLRSADIRSVIAEVSRVTHKNFVIDPRVQGKVSMISGTPINKDALYAVFLSMLQVSGYAAIPNGDIIKIVPNLEAKTLAPKVMDARQASSGDSILVEVVPVRYVPADQLVPVLRPLMPQWSNVSAYTPSNMLILSGNAHNIRMIANIIKQVDTSSASGIDIIPLKHTLAMDVIGTIKDLVKPQASIGSRTLPALAADDRSNSILLSGTRTDRIRLRMIIARLDKRSNSASNSTTQVVYLNYLRAEDLVPILAGIAQANFSGTVGTTIGTITRPTLDSTNPASSLVSNNSNSGSGNTPSLGNYASGANAQTAANTSTATTQNEGTAKPTVQIIAEPNTNSIILNAPTSIIRIMKQVIAQLDIKPAQLLIEALVAEVDENTINDLGVEWGSNQQTGSSANFRPGFAIINSKTSGQDFQAQIYALVRDRKANILSTPSVVVLDNRQAKILVGRQLSVASTTYPNNANGNAPASPYTTFDRVNVALHLYVRPQITRGQGIQLQIDEGNDTVDPNTINAGNPVFNVSSIVTSVQVESGDVVVLGGLTHDSLANSNTDLPLLAEIPGIGRLFQRNIRNREKRVLMVFIRPIILNTEKDALQVSGEKYRGLREHQLKRLREQTFVQSNQETILPALKKAKLPIPFSRMRTRTVVQETTVKAKAVRNYIK